MMERGDSETGADDAAVRRRERAVMAVLASVQFTSIVDFMLIMPLGPQLMEKLAISPARFGLIVSSYTFAAGVAGLLAAPVVDRFGRKAAFLTLYVGFLVGTAFCGLANTYTTLLAARVLTGAFGGILGGMAMTVIGDVFPPNRHGAATGALMSAFSLASVVGVPFGLALGIKYGWQTPFLLLAALGTVVLILAVRSLPTLRGHLDPDRPKPDAMAEMWTTMSHPNHLRAYALVVSMMIGGFAVIPYIPTYLVRNVGVPEERLPYIYVVGGLLTLFASPMIGKLADRFGRLLVFRIVAPVSAVFMIVVTTLPRVPTAVAVATFGLLMVSNAGRMVPALALIMASVEPRRRGSFMSVYSSVQHVSAGLGSYLGGVIIDVAADGALLRYSWVGLFGAAATLTSLDLAGRLRPASASKSISPGFSLGAADASMSDPIDPLPAVESF